MPKAPLPSPPITATVTQTRTAAPTASVTPTFTPSPIPSATWVYQGADRVVVPILLYHHVDVSPSNSQYYVSPEKFGAQMRLLRDWEYTTITVEMLVKAVTEGNTMPPRPILITFDDGNLDTYTNAFPIMRSYGLSGVMYVVGKYIGAPSYMNVDQIKEMARTGWEVGSHGMTHPDLTKIDSQPLNYEILYSRTFLEEKLGLPIISFAYPFGISHCGTNDKVFSAGYIAGMSIGSTSDQCISDLYYMSRLAIKGMYDLEKFSSFLPWHGDLIFLPTNTPIPTGTQIPPQ